MLFRTKLFFASSSIVLLLWAGAWWPIQHLISGNFARMTTANFKATRQSLHGQQIEQVNRMRQAAGMVMNIPELRSLIAESQVEITTENLASLQDRLDSLVTVVDSKFICVLDGRGSLVAQNSSSPWHSIADLKAFLAQSRQAAALVSRVFSKSNLEASRQYGLWIYRGQLYQVVGLPLVFSSDPGEAWRPDGALIMASPVTSELAKVLGKNHDCEISFLSADHVLASSLSSVSQALVLKHYSQNKLPDFQPFDVSIGDTSYASYLEPLNDPCSQTVVGATLIQNSQADTSAMQRKISLSLLAIMSSGLFSAACISFFVSGAITKPVRELVNAVHRVAAGDMKSSLQIGRRDEIGQLATAFNDMVVQVRTRHELQRQVDESQAATKAKSQFLANMSHEIRTPLNGVIGVANLLLSTPLNDRQRHYAQLVRSSTEVLTTLINDILDFSKLEAGKLELETMEFDLRTVVEDVVELLSQKAFGKGVEMSTRFGAGVPHLAIGDANRLRQVLMNLIGNAVKFTDAGEIVVSVSVEGPLLRFAVNDTGPGIPADRMERLFKSFSQVDASTTRRYGGTGLGLAISKQLAELLGGNIGVESESGRGSTFWFTARLPSADTSQSSATTFSGMKILIVHPGDTIAKIIQWQLSESGLSSDIATTAEQADVLLGTIDYAALLVDQKISKTFVTDSPQFLLTTPQQEVARVKLDELKFAGQIVKPIRANQLLQAITAPSLGTAASIEITPTAVRAGRILLAEDNEINQIVASDMLTNAGYCVELAPDGKSAIQKLKHAEYDLILMDCQMPIMDGLEATREIRHMEQNANARRIPIIALTANASGVDRSRCVDAGMDGYCPKPFKPAELLGMIAKLLGEIKTQTASVATEQIDVSADDNNPLRLSTLLDSCTQNPSFAVKILEKFQSQVALAAKEFLALAEDNNRAELTRLSHSLKGTAGIVGADALRVQLGKLEELGRSNTYIFADKEIANLQREIDRCTDFIPAAILQLKSQARTT